jgi:hypothetical protein
MILPDKNITLSNSLIGLGSKIIIELCTPQTVSSLWEKVRKRYLEIKTFERFVLTLDLLYAIGLIELENGIIKRQMK